MIKIIAENADSSLGLACKDRGVETYTNTPDWSGQSFGEIILETRPGMINSILKL